MLKLRDLRERFGVVWFRGFYLVSTTPHPVMIWPSGEKPLVRIPGAFEPLRATEFYSAEGELGKTSADSGIPWVEKRLDTSPYEDLPPLPHVFYIVPLAIAQSYSGDRQPRFLVPDDLIRDHDGRVIGCRRVAFWGRRLVTEPRFVLTQEPTETWYLDMRAAYQNRTYALANYDYFRMAYYLLMIRAWEYFDTPEYEPTVYEGLSWALKLAEAYRIEEKPPEVGGMESDLINIQTWFYRNFPWGDY